MINFQPKAAIFGEPIWLLLSFVVCVIGWIQYSILREYDSTHSYPESLTLLLVQMTAVTTIMGVSPVAHGAVLALWALLGFASLLRKKQGIINLRRYGCTVNYSVVAILVLSVFCIAFTSSQVHYDYFHGAVPSIDLAVHGKSPSEWLSKFDATYWPILTQTLLPTYDALEIYYTGGVLTNSLSLVFLVFLIISILIRLETDSMTQLIITVMCGIYILDFSVTPRSHVLVGFSCALLLLSAKPKWLAITIAIAILILAKRDGTFILMISTSLVFIHYQLKLLIHNSSKAKQVSFLLVYTVLLTLFIYLSGNWVVIKGLTVVEVTGIIINTDSFGVVMRREIIITLLMLCAVIYTLAQDIKGKENPIPAFIVIAVCIHVVLSALLLENLSQYNEGTITRKLKYMLIPAAAIFFASRIRLVKNANA